MPYTIQPQLNLSDTKKKYNGWADYTTWNCALWINNEPTLYNIASEVATYADFLYEMTVMCGFTETPDGADWGEADYTEMNELVKEITTPTEVW